MAQVFHWGFRGLLLLQFATLTVVWASYADQHQEYRLQSIQRHIPSIGKPQWHGCRQKPVEHHQLLGVAKACTSSKPLKLFKVLKKGKDICAKDWTICSIKDKAVQKLSWKTSKMPKGCFAFNYGKAKAAGYGANCNAHYFDGVLCCPLPGTKVHHHQKIAPYAHQKNGKLPYHLNLVE